MPYNSDPVKHNYSKSKAGKLTEPQLRAIWRKQLILCILVIYVSSPSLVLCLYQHTWYMKQNKTICSTRKGSFGLRDFSLSDKLYEEPSFTYNSVNVLIFWEYIVLFCLFAVIWGFQIPLDVWIWSRIVWDWIWEGETQNNTITEGINDNKISEKMLR